MPNKVDRFIRLPDLAETGASRFIALEQVIALFIGRLFPGYTVQRAGRLPGHPRQRHRNRGGGGGSRPAVRDGAEAAPPRLGDPARGRRARCRSRCSSSSPSELDVAADELFIVDGMLALNDLSQLVGARPAGPEVRALQSALSRAHPRPWRRLLRGHPPEGPHRPPPLRILRRRRAVPEPGGARPERGRDQADALPHLVRQPRS